jgi:hypothetical protein
MRIATLSLIRLRHQERGKISREQPKQVLGTGAPARGKASRPDPLSPSSRDGQEYQARDDASSNFHGCPNPGERRQLVLLPVH